MITRDLPRNVAEALDVIEAVRSRRIVTGAWSGRVNVLDTCRDTAQVTIEVRGRTPAGRLVAAMVRGRVEPRRRRGSRLVVIGDLPCPAAVLDALVGAPAEPHPSPWGRILGTAATIGATGAAVVLIARRRWR
jgi:hypothetical protein